MHYLAHPFYAPAVARAKTILALHRPRRSGLFRLWRCDWCNERCGRDGCSARRAALAVYDEHAGENERTWDLACGHLFTPSEALHVTPTEVLPALPSEAFQPRSAEPVGRWGPSYPADAEAVIA
ncbi:hypothetical protein [Glycomyces xiaoerkulensis]|uniref:hypothetical protein n=1 Tax=Glycomyces xiaoerkulensis TaxID=2038139 RepID=UPI0012FFE262|nr:hypothetical protein [Glycomyces xiaoerkulensis]